MSGQATGPAPQPNQPALPLQMPPPGPIEARVLFLWEKTWKAVGEGQQFRFFAVQSEAELNNWRGKLQMLTSQQLIDFENADRLHRSHVEQLGADVANRDWYRNEMKSLRDQIAREITRVNFYAFQTLGLGNGAVVISTLGYIGQSSLRPVPAGLVGVLVLASSGFFLNLLSAHVATLTASGLLALTTELSALFLSDAKRAQLQARWQPQTKRAIWPTRILSYLFAICLFAAFVVGAVTLLHVPAERDIAPSAKTYLL